MNAHVKRTVAARIADPRTATTTALMATDAMRSLPFQALCDVIEAHLEAMPHDQIDPARLDNLANKLGRIAHMAGRGA